MRNAFAVLALVTLAAPLSQVAGQEKVVYETDSLYHHIVVSQTPRLRILRFHKGPAEEALGSSFAQSIISIEDPYELYMGYTKYSMAGISLVDKPRRALFIGLGAGSLPKFFARIFPECQVDVAEIDGKVVEVARRYFFFPQMSNVNVTVMDGRMFLRKSEHKYDVIFLDAYRDRLIPFHLMTREFFEEVKEKLSPGGLLVSNIAVRTSAQLYPWMLRTYQGSFPTLLESNVAGSINKVLVASPSPDAATVKDIVEKSEALSRSSDLGFDIATCAAGYTDVSSQKKSERVLTDDYAPVNIMWLRKADEKDWKY